jgi:hypothetical protein
LKRWTGIIFLNDDSLCDEPPLNPGPQPIEPANAEWGCRKPMFWPRKLMYGEARLTQSHKGNELVVRETADPQYHARSLLKRRPKVIQAMPSHAWLPAAAWTIEGEDDEPLLSHVVLVSLVDIRRDTRYVVSGP